MNRAEMKMRELKPGEPLFSVTVSADDPETFVRTLRAVLAALEEHSETLAKLALLTLDERTKLMQVLISGDTKSAGGSSEPEGGAR